MIGLTIFWCAIGGLLAFLDTTSSVKVEKEENIQ